MSESKLRARSMDFAVSMTQSNNMVKQFVGFKGERNASCVLVRHLSESFYLLTNSSNGIRNDVSNKPTHYLCNEAYWLALIKFNGRAAFIHIPSLKNIDDDFIAKMKRAVG